MKYEDLDKMYWSINYVIAKLNENELDDVIDVLNWVIATINEELRQLESSDSSY